MSMTTEKTFKRLVETPEIEDCDHDLIRDLGRRLSCLWEYDRYIANADGRPELQAFRRGVTSREQTNIEQLKELSSQHTQSNCS